MPPQKIKTDARCPPPITFGAFEEMMTEMEMGVFRTAILSRNALKCLHLGIFSRVVSFSKIKHLNRNEQPMTIEREWLIDVAPRFFKGHPHQLFVPPLERIRQEPVVRDAIQHLQCAKWHVRFKRSRAR